jgi:nucleoside-diphosphate-sugar epimerase
MSNILVTGAGGYIGIPLCSKLLERGHSVIAVDRYYFGLHKMNPIGQNSRARVLVEDIRDLAPQHLEGVDVVVDLAGLSNDASAEIDPALTHAINFEGGMRMARIAKEMRIRRYVYGSSASVYGHGLRDGLTENDECRPQTLYAKSKLSVEALLRELASPDFEIVILRNATVFGLAPRMRFDLAINIMTLRAWKERVIYIMGGGNQWRPFVHVNDVVRAFVLAVESEADQIAGETFNVGGDDMNFQIRQLAQFVMDIIPNVAVHMIPDDPDLRTYSLSFAKVKQRLGFVPEIRVHEGIVEIKQALERGVISSDDPTCHTLQWYRSLLEWEERIKTLSLRNRIL